MSGSMRSSQPGSHQFASPISSIVVGTRIRRTTVASSAIATASPTPISLICGMPVPAKIAKTATMIRAALEIVPALAARPCGDGLLVVAGGLVALLDAREHEDLVVHREAEDDRQQERGRDRLDVAERLEAQEAVEPAPLEDDHQHAVGRATDSAFISTAFSGSITLRSTSRSTTS